MGRRRCLLQYFMMGDNRDRSYDGRFWGFVKLDQVEGRAMFIYWSWVLTANRFSGYGGAGLGYGGQIVPNAGGKVPVSDEAIDR